MSIISASQKYEAWLGTQCDVVEKDLEYKHKRMTKDPFTFLRATFYRWAAKVEKWCPDLADAPTVLSVGDAHTENFGTWRDAESRLVWGINDFDEAAVIPYAFDLVRLATSAALAPGRFLSKGDISSAILAGYRGGLNKPRPTLLDEQETWMRPYVAVTDKQRDKFWCDVDDLVGADPPDAVRTATARFLSETAEVTGYFRRVAGGGSLGRPRFVAVATWRGGRICREAKAQVASAWNWAHDQPLGLTEFMQLAHGPFRSPDAVLQTTERFIYRRFASDSRKVELGDDAGTKLNSRLLQAMGFDIGAIHAADDRVAHTIKKDLARRESDWLRKAVKTTCVAVTTDYDVWCAG